MSGQSVEGLLEHLSQTAPTLHEIVVEVRSLVHSVAPGVEERVMYGGIVFEAPIMFCGVFAYTRHVSVEFSRGCDLADAYGVLEGKGVRRHLKLREPSDVEGLHVREFVSSAYAELLPE
jgi:hypothetical protein